MTVSIHNLLWPLAISTTKTSTPASTKAFALSNSFAPTAAPTYSYPFGSRFAKGRSSRRSISLSVANP